MEEGSSFGTNTGTSAELGLLCFALFACCLAWCLRLVGWLKTRGVWASAARSCSGGGSSSSSTEWLSERVTE